MSGLEFRLNSVLMAPRETRNLAEKWICDQDRVLSFEVMTGGLDAWEAIPSARNV